MKILPALFALVNLAWAASIRDVDFKNFAYPFIESKFVSVPSMLRWMPHSGASQVSPHDGRYTFSCDDSPCPLLTVDQIDFGKISGLPETCALVSTTYHTGGTATWQYLYVIALRLGRPKVMAWLESGSRADMGLRSASVNRGDLVLIVNDPNKRMGDCCSTGSIAFRYRWRNASFYRIGARVLADDPQ